MLLRDHPQTLHQPFLSSQRSPRSHSNFDTFFREEIRFYAHVLCLPKTPHILGSKETLQNLIDEYNLVMASFRVPVPLHTLSPELQFLWRVHAMYGDDGFYLADIERQYGTGCNFALTNVTEANTYDPEVKEDEERSFASVDLFSASIDALAHIEYIFGKFFDLPSNIRGQEQLISEWRFWRESDQCTCDERVCRFIERMNQVFTSMSETRHVAVRIDDDDFSSQSKIQNAQAVVMRKKSWTKVCNRCTTTWTTANIAFFSLIIFLLGGLFLAMGQTSWMGASNLNELISRRGNADHIPREASSWPDMSSGHRRRLQNNILQNVTIVLVVVLVLCASLVLVIFLCACCRAEQNCCEMCSGICNGDGGGGVDVD